MASKSLNLLLNSALAAMAVGVVAFNTGMLDPLLSSKSTETSAATDTAVSEPEDEATGTKPEETAADGDSQETAAADAEASDDAAGTEGDRTEESDVSPDIVPPRFDIVRVESDGNVVIAGNAAAGSAVEVITGTRTLGTAEAGPEGDFAVVLNDPLDPGDYTIVLRTTTPGNVVAMSAETAIVSVPEDEAGDVLAIVDEPGKPSKLITVPEAEAENEAAPVEAEAETQVAVADPSKQDEKATETTSSETETTDAAASEPEADAKPEDSVPEAADVQEEPATEETATEVAAVETDETEAAAAEADAPAVTATEEVEAAKIEPAADLNIAVEAVEIEGDSVFVAGTANPGKVVRIYANKDLIGETRSSEIGRFLVESNRGLTVGEYIIRADMLEVGSADVIARAAVPFEREAGASVAAVAPAVTGDETTKPDDGDVEVATSEQSGATESESETVAETEESSKSQSDVESAEETSVADGSSAESAAAEEETAAAETAVEKVAAADQASDVADAAKEAEATEVAAVTEAETNEMAVATEDEIKASDPIEADTESAAGESGTKTAMAVEVKDTTADSGNASEVNEASESGDAASEQSTGTQTAAAEPGEIEYPKFDEDVALTAPKLEKTSGAVIIRRGDTLWRISRRVYGRGIRYTTIYTANRDQIENPHRIWPGQIFDVPGESDEGETADLEAIADQAPGTENADQVNSN